MTSRGSVDRIERKLLSLMESSVCSQCAQRSTRCAECGRAVGTTVGEAEEARERLLAGMERLGRVSGTAVHRHLERSRWQPFGPIWQRSRAQVDITLVSGRSWLSNRLLSGC